MAIFNTEVTKIGPEAELFKEEKMIILFGDNAPDGLAEYCYNIVLNATHGEILDTQELVFDDKGYRITSVGHVVNKNLNELGHITIKFNGATNPELAGTLYVEEKELPEIHVGTKISIK